MTAFAESLVPGQGRANEETYRPLFHLPWCNRMSRRLPFPIGWTTGRIRQGTPPWHRSLRSSGADATLAIWPDHRHQALDLAKNPRAVRADTINRAKTTAAGTFCGPSQRPTSAA